MLLAASLVLLAVVPSRAKSYEVSGPLVILMHGIFSSKDFNPMPSIARKLAAEGIASIRFDFNGHGSSEGRMQDMTVEKEIADALAVWDYACSLPYASSIGLLGHSQERRR